MRDVRDEIAPERFEPSQVGDVDEDGEHSARLPREGGRVDEESARFNPGEIELSGDGHVPRPRPLDEVVELGVTDGLDEELSDVTRPQKKHLAQRGVYAQQDAIIAIEDQNPPLSSHPGSAPARSRLGAKLAEARGEASRKLIERAPEIPQLVVPREVGPHAEVAAGHPAGHVGELSYDPRHRPRREGRHDPREDERDAWRPR